MKPPQKLTPGKPSTAQRLKQPSPQNQFTPPGFVQPRSCPSKHHPAAPPAYRPQPTPRVLQTKASAGQQSQNLQPRAKSVAPPAYRPQPVPGVLQAKKSDVRQTVNPAGRAPLAPPAYRPQATPRVLQTKRPQSLRPQNPPLENKRAAVAPPAYRPQPAPQVLQAKSAGVRQPSAKKGKDISPLPSQARLPIQMKPDVIQMAPPAAPPAVQTPPTLTGTGGKAKTVTSTILPGALDGGAPSVAPVGWDWLYQNLPKVKGTWVRFHILNRKLGGPGNNVLNLIPTTHLDNHSPSWRQFEAAAQAAHDTGKTIHWEGEVDGYYGVPAAPTDGFPTGLSAEYWVWDAAGRKWDEGKKVGLKFAAPSAGDDGGSMLLHASELTGDHWKAVGIAYKPIRDWLVKNRENWKLPLSNIVKDLEDAVFGKYNSWEPYLEKAAAAIESALGGKRTARPSIYQGPP